MILTLVVPDPPPTRKILVGRPTRTRRTAPLVSAAEAPDHPIDEVLQDVGRSSRKVGLRGMNGIGQRTTTSCRFVLEDR
jgi:hypothetical protein